MHHNDKRGVFGYDANDVQMELNLVNNNGGTYDSAAPVGGVIAQGSAGFYLIQNTICGNVDANGNPYQSNFTIGGNNTVQDTCP